MSNTDRNANDLKEWEQTTVSIAANAPDLPQTDVTRVALEKLTEELRKLVVEQKLFQANRQQATQRMDVIHREGSKLATILRFMVKQHYGRGNDKLVELGVQPVRSRPRKVTPKPSPPTTGPTPAVPTTPTPPAAK